MSLGVATRLTSPELAALLERAAREAGRFLDPARFQRIRAWAPDTRSEWAAAILGHRFAGIRWTPWQDLVLLDLAHEAEPNPPELPRVVAARAELDWGNAELAAQHAHRMDDWARLRAALPVHVEVVHNYTSTRHYSDYVQGVDHLMLREPLAVGRLRRDPGHPLCWTPSRDRDLQHFSDGYEDRAPECKACIRTAGRIASPTITEADAQALVQSLLTAADHVRRRPSRR